jgi:hypothetical protein
VSRRALKHVRRLIAPFLLAAASQRIAVPLNFPLSELLQRATELDRDDYAEETLLDEFPELAPALAEEEPLDLSTPPSSSSLKRSRGSEDEVEEEGEGDVEVKGGPGQPEVLSKNQRRKRNKRHQDGKKRYAGEGHQPREKVKKKYVQTAQDFSSDISLPKLPVTSVGFTGLENPRGKKPQLPNLAKLLQDGYKYIPWDGR